MSYEEVKKSLLLLVIITIIVAGMLYYVLTFVRAQRQKEYISEMNIYCANLSTYINIIKNNFTECMNMYNDTVVCNNTPGEYNFSCYFAECPTQSKYLNEKTASLCVCDVTYNNQTSTICVRKVK